MEKHIMSHKAFGVMQFAQQTRFIQSGTQANTVEVGHCVSYNFLMLRRVDFLNNGLRRSANSTNWQSYTGQMLYISQLITITFSCIHGTSMNGLSHAIPLMSCQNIFYLLKIITKSEISKSVALKISLRNCLKPVN